MNAFIVGFVMVAVSWADKLKSLNCQRFIFGTRVPSFNYQDSALFYNWPFKIDDQLFLMSVFTVETVDFVQS
jgi:hypothetical protein